MKKSFFASFVLVVFISVLIISCDKKSDDKQNPDPVPEFPDCGNITDIDGNLYGTIKIGNQCWFRDNLKVTHYRNGDPIETTENPDSGINDEEIPKYQWVLEGEEDNLNTYGRIYTWYVTTDSRNICPQGWHVPSDDDWKILEIELGMSQEDADKTGNRGAYIGSAIAGNSSLWKNTQGALVLSEYFGSSGFDGLPGGARNSGGSPVSPGYSTYWWSTTPAPVTVYDSSSYVRYINYESSGITRMKAINKFGFYVRCVKD